MSDYQKDIPVGTRVRSLNFYPLDKNDPGPVGVIVEPKTRHLPKPSADYFLVRFIDDPWVDDYGRGEYADLYVHRERLEILPPEPLWKREFGERYRPEQAVLDLADVYGVVDDSWHNDVRPHFTYITNDPNDQVEIWFDAADPKDRDDPGNNITPDCPRYFVYRCNPEQGYSDDYLNPVYAGEDGAEAARVFLELAEAINKKK